MNSTNLVFTFAITAFLQLETELSLHLNPRPTSRTADKLNRDNCCDIDVIQGEEDIRYFHPNSTELLSLEQAVLDNPNNASAWQCLANKKLSDPNKSQKECVDASLHVLCRGLESARNSPDLWHDYLTLYRTHPQVCF